MTGSRSDFRVHPEFHENLLAALSQGIMVLNQEDRIIYMNPSMEQICQASFLSLRERPFREFAVRNPHLQAVVEKTRKTGVSHHEMDYPFCAAKGTIIPLLTSTSLLSGRHGRLIGIALAFQDNRHFKEIETRNRQAKRLQILGTLAATMAHEIKNPLGGIRGSAQLLKLMLRDEELQVYFEAIIKEVDRINRIVETALDLRKDRHIKKASVNIHKVLNEILALEKKNGAASSVAFKVEFDPSIPDIPADEGQLIQVFLNLIRNGVESMDGKGELCLLTRISPDCQVQREQGKSPSRMLAVEILDRGKGIPKDVRENLFTPFFSTKRNGSGLGLVISQQIIEKHGGWIELLDNPPRGTRVRVFLPLT